MTYLDIAVTYSKSLFGREFTFGGTSHRTYLKNNAAAYSSPDRTAVPVGLFLQVDRRRSPCRMQKVEKTRKSGECFAVVTGLYLVGPLPVPGLSSVREQ